MNSPVFLFAFAALIPSSQGPSGSIHSARRFIEFSPAVIEGTNTAATFSIAQNSTMSIATNGGAPVTITFDQHFGAATLGALVAVEINDDLAAAGVSTFASFTSNRIVIQSPLSGPTSSLKITDGAGSPAASLGLSTSLVKGFQAPIVSSSRMNFLSDNVSDYVTGDKINLNGTLPNGAIFSSQFIFGPSNDGETMGDLITFLNSSPLFDASSPAGATASISLRGNIVVAANSGSVGALSLQIADEASNVGMTHWEFHPFIP